MECDSNYNIVNSRKYAASQWNIVSLYSTIVLLLKRKWMPCILCPETLGVIGGLLMSSAELFHTIGRSGSSVYRFAILVTVTSPQRYSALFMWLKRRTLRKTGEGVPLFGAGVWTLAQNGVWWADLKNIRLFGPLLLSSIVADMPTCGGFPHLPSAWLTQHCLSVLLDTQSNNNFLSAKHAPTHRKWVVWRKCAKWK